MKNKRTLTLLLACILALGGTQAQSIWDKNHLEYVKESIDQPAYNKAYQALIEQAEQAMESPAPSVMMKEKAPASGDKHDYMSQARYVWPDPTKPDGLPYITRDGQSNPEINKFDRNRLGEMANRVTTLSLAWYFSGDDKYAVKATELIRVWFFNKDTRMNPNLNYAQIVPGLNDNKGRCYGVIDAYSFVEMLDGVQLLENSKAFTAKDSRQLKQWFKQFLNWMLTSEQGLEESRQKNNHAVAYDAQVIAFALYSGETQLAEKLIKEFPERRIFTHIEPDGKQPNELWRTLAFGYSQYNLSHMIDIFLMGHKIGLSIENSISPDGRNFYKALDYLAQFYGKDKSTWPYQQISEWDYKQSELGKDLYRISIFNPERTDYLQLYRQHQPINWEDRFNLTFFKADVVDNAFAFADGQLSYAMVCTEDVKKQVPEKRYTSPRTVEKDGSLRLIGPRDWCSGFFPGSLWQMYGYTKSDFWREHAISYTWPIEEMKNYKGTHDVGFIINCSFGQAYRFTGERSYKDVNIRAAQSLITRYNDNVKAIRSWDWNPKTWQFPVIIDNMMNLELLFEATRHTGDSIYHNVAVNHANTTIANHFRDDYSSYHVIGYDTITGKAHMKITHQGIADESVWSRGQAWGLYGYTMCYRYTKDPAYLKQAENIANFFFNLPNLSSGFIPFWDMNDPAIPYAPHDASAAAIFASALYELSTYTSGTNSAGYRRWADTIIDTLQEDYQADPYTTEGFLLLHSTGNYPKNDEIDAPINYADYYYLEALLRRIGITNY